MTLHLGAIPQQTLALWEVERVHQLSATNIKQLVDQLILLHPKARPLLDAEGNLRRLVGYSINEKIPMFARDAATLALQDGDEVWLVPAICSLLLEVVLRDLAR